MDDRITRIERLAALHREGALSDDEFRDEKLRVLAGRDDAGIGAGAGPVAEAEPVVAAPVEEPAPVFEERVFEEHVSQEPVSEDPALARGEAISSPYAPPARERTSNTGWWLGGTAVAVVALAGAIWYASSIEVADASRSSIGHADSRTLAAPAPVAPEPEEVATDLSDALAFSDIGQCEFAGEADRAFDALLSQRGGEWTTNGPVTLGAMTLTPKLEVERSTSDDGMTSASYYSSARAPEGVLWNGLKLSRIVHSLNLPEGTDSLEERSITFLEDPDRVQRTLRTLGVKLPVGEGYRELEDGGCGGSMQIKAIPGGSALVCQWGC